MKKTTKKITAAKADTLGRKKTPPRSSSASKRLSQEMALLIDNTEESFIAIDTDFTIIICNKQFLKFYAKYFKQEPKKGESILDYLLPERKEMVTQIFLKVFAGEKAESQMELADAKGVMHIFSNRFKPTYDEKGVITGAAVISVDITRKREAERQMKEERMLLRTLIDNLPINVYTKDLNSKKTLANRTDYEYSGADSEETVLGKDDFEFFSYESAKTTLEEDQFIFNTGQSILGKEEYHVKKDGSDIWFLISKIPLKNVNNEITGLLGISFNITERKRAEKSLRESEERYRTLTERVSDAFIAIDNNWNYTYVNVKAGELLNQDPAFLIGKNMWEVAPESIGQPFYTALHEAKKTQQSAHLELYYPPSDRWYEDYIYPTPNGITVHYREITEQKKAHEALEKSKYQLTIATKLAKLGYWELNIAEGVFTFNDYFYDMLETSAEEIGGYTMKGEDYAKRFLHPDDTTLVREEIIKAIETTDPNYTRHLEHRIIYPDGRVGHLAVRFFVVKDEQGRTIRTVGANQDITDRKEAEEQLRQSKERYDTVAKATNDVIYEWDIINNVNYWGEGYETLFGHMRTSDKMETITWVNNLHPDDRDDLLARTREAFENKETSLTRELRFKCADGSYKTVFDKLIILYDTNGKPVKIVGAMQDITERKHSEIAIQSLNQQLNKRAGELAASNADLEQFAYVASHDLQEPLRMVSSFLQLLQKKYNDQLDDSARQYISYAVDGSDRMKQLIMDLLEYSRVGTNQDKLVKTEMNEVLTQVLETFDGKIKETSAVIKTQPMPSIKVNRTQITQLLQNLVGNALKYNTSAVPEIEIGCEEKRDAWQFFIKDNGIGIEPKFFDKVFVIFQRLHNKKEFSGTGIGLAICKKIVEKHGGMIWIESGPEKGSTFFFTIKK
jgi:PAS domain S-box-containing protein